jgi:hypothetical protein
VDERRIIQMIDEYLTEPHSISNEWVQALLVCKQALIDNKKKDIEIDILIRKKKTLRDEITEQKAEIENLQIRNKTLTDISQNYDWKFAKAKSEARKEFWERLKSKKCAKGSRVIYVDRIKETLKEMEGE